MQRSKDSQVGGQQKDSINVVVEVTYLSVYFIYLTSQIDPDISNHSPVGLVRCSLTLIAAGLYEVLESGHAIVFYNPPNPLIDVAGFSVEMLMLA